MSLTFKNGSIAVRRTRYRLTLLLLVVNITGARVLPEHDSSDLQLQNIKHIEGDTQSDKMGERALASNGNLVVYMDGASDTCGNVSTPREGNGMVTEGESPTGSEQAELKNENNQNKRLRKSRTSNIHAHELNTKNLTLSNYDDGVIHEMKVQRDKRIVNGENVERNSWPWMCSLQRQQSDSELRFFCGCVVINNRWVITAAHCLRESMSNEPIETLYVVVGDHDLFQEETGEKAVHADYYVIHDNYNSETLDSDIALIKLASELIYNRNVNAIYLPSSLIAHRDNCIITGWGETQGTGDVGLLQQADVPLLSSQLCNSSRWHDGLITDNMICAGYGSGNVDACVGDSGGPLMCPVALPSDVSTTFTEERYELVGITSWGSGCGSKRLPGVYTRVSKFVTWILDTMMRTA